ncbi:ABC transporter ATP-binding protein [Prescottella agglutinans]|uniref:ABC transporter ATP-binding protein n=1 Tax=Prescottella agglutinans TaxID=1644129 RepID=A0A438BI90_9NOCA|nr:ABC transporter ATP-binding protein [Prescottella agglutinans]RVW10674.1 ABC transporter ATP-binding protein [Prescottella agglutinans]
MSIDLRDIVLTYPDGDTRLRVLDEVNLHVDRGHLVAVTGPSGSGKSSILAVAGLLTSPDSGTVTIDGTDVTGLDRAARTDVRREKLGFVFQQSNLLPSLTATEQLEMITHLNGGKVRESRRRARDLLSSLGLEGQLDRRPHQLSGGQRQRVAIARSLVNDPAVLLVDEPTSALDEERSREIVALLADLSRERSVATVMVTHDLNQLDLVDAAYEMHSGRLRPRAAVPTVPVAATGAY